MKRQPPTHGRDHSHNHAVTATSANRRKLVAVLAITLSVMVVQAIGAWISGSLSLLADAGHMLTDSAGVAIALLAATLATRPATDLRTFGWQRAEILAALANATVLCAVGVLVIREAFLRWGAEPEVESGIMLGAAVLGAIANLVSLAILTKARGQSLNMRGAYLEVFGDLLGSVAVIAAAIVIMTTGWVRADAIASFAIGLLILPRAILLLKDVADVLLESTPKDVDLTRVREHIAGIPGVVDVHDLHAWTITSGVPVLSAHVVLDADEVDYELGCRTLDALDECLEGHFDVAHCTFQLEPKGHLRHERAVHD
ncbi:cation diffusion facilitator family transporter [Ruania zhangjianzhongii]|uniref:cation diffusion facilitator family transporter n=1 Tax=Ruania zhangjianzhongii TaxID=2603206 RepID=UPI0011C6FD01|nr:cation diffusion facilitator family transporter [Ruania zhangjianzhongii]